MNHFLMFYTIVPAFRVDCAATAVVGARRFCRPSMPVPPRRRWGGPALSLSVNISRLASQNRSFRHAKWPVLQHETGRFVMR